MYFCVAVQEERGPRKKSRETRSEEQPIIEEEKSQKLQRKTSFSAYF